MMDFRVGDPVIHWTFGLGEIVGLEERDLTTEKMLYYMVRVQNLTVCVPADGRAMSRLRPPTSQGEFKKLFLILSGSGETLSDDRLERRTQLRKELADGKVETTCRVIRDLSFFAQKKSLNDDDKNILNRACSSLCGEWGYSLSVTPAQAEVELQRLLVHPAEPVAG
jgi:RNA polymerase-interacting CarD/CdnL/TRCF family regulator